MDPKTNKPQPPPEDQANEFVYTDEEGNRADSDLHEALFEDGAEEESSRETYEQALEDGMEPELADLLYG